MASTSWTLLMLLLVLALIPLALWLLKRLQTLQVPGGGPRPLQVAGQLALGARERVVLVRVQDRLLVLGVTPQQISLLTEADASQLPAPAAPGAAADFGKLLRQSLGRGGQP